MRKRQSIRLRHYNYTQGGAYFITICTTQRECLFGTIRDSTMFRNTTGDLIAHTWHSLQERFHQIALDEFVVMPNHLHGILCINYTAPTPASVTTQTPSPALGDIVRVFKSISAIAANRSLRRQGQPLWQRNYYERIIRNEEEWHRIREYIIDNPARWHEDTENPLQMREHRSRS